MSRKLIHRFGVFLSIVTQSRYVCGHAKVNDCNFVKERRNKNNFVWSNRAVTTTTRHRKYRWNVFSMSCRRKRVTEHAAWDLAQQIANIRMGFKSDDKSFASVQNIFTELGDISRLPENSIISAFVRLRFDEWT